MGQRISVYFTDEALGILDKLVEEHPLRLGFKASRSGLLSDLLVQQGEVYLERLRLVGEAIKKFSATAPEAKRKPINIEEYERVSSLEEYAEKLGVGDE